VTVVYTRAGFRLPAVRCFTYVRWRQWTTDSRNIRACPSSSA